MDNETVFTISDDRLSIRGLKALKGLLRFSPEQPGIFIEGLELFEDLRTEAGTIIYTEGTSLTRERIDRLTRLKEANPKLELAFSLRISEELIEKFREELVSFIGELLERRRENERFSRLFRGFDEKLGPVLDSVLESRGTVLDLYRLRLVCESAELRKAARFYESPFEVMLVSLAIALSARYDNIISRKGHRLGEVALTALFHNRSALHLIDGIAALPDEEAEKQYWEAIRRGHSSLGESGVSGRVVEAIGHICEYTMSDYSFLRSKEWNALMAGIVVTAIVFVRYERGLFGEPHPVKLVVDQLNNLAVVGQQSREAVEGLSDRLGLGYIFEFYTHMDELKRLCPYGSAAAYPLTGYKSPTLFVCRKTVVECEYLEGSRNAINLIKTVGDLDAGKYYRCGLLTPRLMKFYDRHYEEIKGSGPGPSGGKTPGKGEKK